MKPKIIIIAGESGCGKDSIARQICDKNPNKYWFVVSATTRPQREYEIHGIDYVFLTKQEFKQAKKIEETSFNGWYYGTLEESLDKDRINVIVANPSGIKALLRNKDVDILRIVRLEVSDKERLMRQLNREQNPNVKEIVRRYSTDQEDFQEFEDWCKIKNIQIERFKNETQLDFDYILGQFD